MTDADRLNDDGLARQREVDLRWSNHETDHSSHDHLHQLEHAHEQELARHEENQLGRALTAHEHEHVANELAVKTALASVDQLARLHADAHSREHMAHEQRHTDAQEAIIKAETSIDKRLESLNEFRSQLRDERSDLASSERVGLLEGNIDRRFTETIKHADEKHEDNRRRIEILEKGDIKSEGKSLGQGAVVAILVTAIGVVGTLLGIVIVIANLVTGAP